MKSGNENRYRFLPLAWELLPLVRKYLHPPTGSGIMIGQEVMALKVTTVIDPQREEEVVIYLKKESDLSKEIAKLVAGVAELVGYMDGAAIPLVLEQVYCFVVQDGKVCAHTPDGILTLKSRLYQLEETLPAQFIKINQSCVANIRQIQRFDTSFSGTLRVIFKNGYVDYVSRRQLKSVKERLGLR